jgi:hypothetical protein
VSDLFSQRTIRGMRVSAHWRMQAKNRAASRREAVEGGGTCRSSTASWIYPAGRTGALQGQSERDAACTLEASRLAARLTLLAWLVVGGTESVKWRLYGKAAVVVQTISFSEAIKRAQQLNGFGSHSLVLIIG